MKKKVMWLLSLSFMLGLGAFAQGVAELPVKTIKGISGAMNGTDTVAVFGVTEAYGNTEDTFKALACVVPKGNTTDEVLEAGLCYLSNNFLPSVVDSTTFFSKQSRVKNVLLSGLNGNTKYYYRIFVKTPDGNVAYGKVHTTTTLPGVSLCPDSHHPHVIDLGLPSGTKWACCNVEAKTPEGNGGYYAWGEIQEKSSYTWETYLYGDAEKHVCTISVDDISGTSYDVAHVKMGGTWYMPNKNEYQELFSSCSEQWTNIYGTNGMLLTGKNGRHLFLPAAGVNGQTGLVYVNELCSYWKAEKERSFYIFNGSWFNDDLYLCVGLPVRAVYKNN